mmetsp:Transcript_15373/g.47903  ORF Transcript_15373/g.47903 Transcript_15373/m.47903 type:complete len:241 (-) Transcript_15373:466-1188(-)
MGDDERRRVPQRAARDGGHARARRALPRERAQDMVGRGSVRCARAPQHAPAACASCQHARSAARRDAARALGRAARRHALWARATRACRARRARGQVVAAGGLGPATDCRDGCIRRVRCYRPARARGGARCRRAGQNAPASRGQPQEQGDTRGPCAARAWRPRLGPHAGRARARWRLGSALCMCERRRPAARTHVHGIGACRGPRRRFPRQRQDEGARATGRLAPRVRGVAWRRGASRRR